VPYLSASAVVSHYEEALYQVYAPLPLPLEETEVALWQCSELSLHASVIITFNIQSSFTTLPADLRLVDNYARYFSFRRVWLRLQRLVTAFWGRRVQIYFTHSLTHSLI